VFLLLKSNIQILDNSPWCDKIYFCRFIRYVSLNEELYTLFARRH